MIRKKDRKICKDCKVIPGESLTTQHRVVVLDIRLKHSINRKKIYTIPRIKWWKLKDGKQNIFKEKVEVQALGEIYDDSNTTWDKMVSKLKIVAKSVLGESKGHAPLSKESWWWNEKVQEKVKEKRIAYKELYICKIEENLKKYTIAKKEAKKVVSEAKNETFERLYQKLDTKEGERDVYKIAKVRERKTRDFIQIRCIKDECNTVLVNDGEIKEWWKRYFHQLFNEGFLT